jgi:hypothetical protein
MKRAIRYDIEIWDVIDISSDREAAVAGATLAFDQAKHEGKQEVTLPLATFELLLRCAEESMSKGSGRKGGLRSLRLRYENARALQEAIAWARKRKAELIASGTSKNATDAKPPKKPRSAILASPTSP